MRGKLLFYWVTPLFQGGNLWRLVTENIVRLGTFVNLWLTKLHFPNFGGRFKTVGDVAHSSDSTAVSTQLLTLNTACRGILLANGYIRFEQKIWISRDWGCVNNQLSLPPLCVSKQLMNRTFPML